MALDENKAATVVIEQLGLTEADRPRVVALVPIALASFSIRASEGPAYEGMQHEYSAIPVAGRLDLAGLAGILFDLDRSTVRAEATNLHLTPVDRPETLEAGVLQDGATYYALDGSDLVFGTSAGLDATYATPLKIKSNRVLTSLSDLPEQYERAFLASLAEEVLSRDVTKQMGSATEAARAGRAET